MKLREITNSLEKLAPLSLQESYDNCGLLVGDPESHIGAALLTLDCTEAVVDEAIALKCNLIIAHHPLIFQGLKRLSGATDAGRALLKAIKNDIAIYAIHTNLDNVPQGVNQMMAEKLGLQQCRVLEPREGQLCKLVVFVPHSHAAAVRQALFDAGAGHIGQYDQCSFNLEGHGTFRGSAESTPFAGQAGSLHTEPETRVEVILPRWKERDAVAAMRSAHPYEEVAFDLYPLLNVAPIAGAGMVGLLPAPEPVHEFLQRVKTTFGARAVRHTALVHATVEKVALCGGSGSFLLRAAIQAGAQVFISADFKYHQFFDAENRIVIADIGHFESEQYTPVVIERWLASNFPTFATHFSRVNTNPIQYL